MRVSRWAVRGDEADDSNGVIRPVHKHKRHRCPSPQTTTTHLLVSIHLSYISSFHSYPTQYIMNNLDWDSKTVIGYKAKAPKVARTESDLNGEYMRACHKSRMSLTFHLHLFLCSRMSYRLMQRMNRN